MLKKILFLFCCLVSAMLNAADKAPISVGTAPEKFIVDKIVNGKLQVHCIMPQGKNMHDFTASPIMLKAVAQSKIFFHSGLLFENQIAEALQQSNTKIVDLAANIPKLQITSPIHNDRFTHTDDVHTWFCYSNLLLMAAEVAETAGEIYPRYAADFKNNYEKFKAEIEKSRDNTAKKLRRFAGRTFLTHHAAFGYFAHEFNLKQMPFEFNGRDITPRHAASLSKFAREHNIKRIFIQSTAPANVRRALSRSSNAKLSTIDPANYDILSVMNKFATELEASFE